MTTILSDIKAPIGIDINNLDFDSELLIFVNSARSDLAQYGVTALGDMDIVEITPWPVFPSASLKHMVKHYMTLSVRKAFDPSASQAIQSAIDSQLIQLEGRIINEVEVLNAT